MAEDGEVSEAQMAADVQRREGEVTALLSKKDKLRALQCSLQSPPTASKNSDLKDANASIVERVLNSLADSDIAPMVEGLDLEACDVLMKYVYRFNNASAEAAAATAADAGRKASDSKTPNLAMLLKLHSLLFEKVRSCRLVPEPLVELAHFYSLPLPSLLPPPAHLLTSIPPTPHHTRRQGRGQSCAA